MPKKTGAQVVDGLKRDLERLFDIRFNKSNGVDEPLDAGHTLFYSASFLQTCSTVVKNLERLVEEHKWSVECDKCERAGVDQPMHPDKIRRRQARLALGGMPKL